MMYNWNTILRDKGHNEDGSHAPAAHRELILVLVVGGRDTVHKAVNRLHRKKKQYTYDDHPVTFPASLSP